MFVNADFKVSGNMFAFVKGSFNRYTFMNWERSDKVTYTAKGYWFSTRPNTKGSLASGIVTFLFDENEAELDGLSTYHNLSEEEIMEFATLKGNHDKKDVHKEVRALFGNGTVYSSYVKDDEYRELVENWFKLTEAPANTYGWMKHKRQ